MLPCGFSALKTLHAMGSGAGLASGFGKLREFGLQQPALAVCGDSTFFHAVLPALVNAVHNRSELTLVVLDNSGTAMTGFQPHPGLPVDAMGGVAAGIDIVALCRSVGADVHVCDPFDLAGTRDRLLKLLGLEKEISANARDLVLRYVGNVSGGSFFQIHPTTFREMLLASEFKKVEIVGEYLLKNRRYDLSINNVVFHCHV